MQLLMEPHFGIFGSNELDDFVVRYKPPSELMERMFHFTSESMKSLKAKANKDNVNNDVIISSFQALAALIWRAIVRAYELAPNEVTNCHLAINVRKRLDPPLPDDYFGNALSNIMTSTTAGDLLSQSLGLAGTLLNESIKKYTDGAVVSDDHWAEAPYFIDLSTFSDLRSVRFGSSPRFEIYSNEFKGLGRPVAVRSGNGNKFVGKVNTYPGCEGGGSVDFEICLLPQQMAILESDPEFMDFVSLAI
uniref:BAHD acyltransferase n=1 Tax=Chenopodium quinoa TaxID=63459 RepID=A0A803LRC2_CHEQI